MTRLFHPHHPFRFVWLGLLLVAAQVPLLFSWRTGFYLFFIYVLALLLKDIYDSFQTDKRLSWADLSFILITAAQPAISYTIIEIVTAFLLIGLIYGIHLVSKTEAFPPRLYNVGLLCGCVLLVYPSLILLPVFCTLALVVYNIARIKNVIALWLGIATPIYCMVAYFFIYQNQYPPDSFLPTWRSNWGLIITPTAFQTAEYSLFILIAALVGLLVWQNATSVEMQRNRTFHILFAFICLVNWLLFSNSFCFEWYVFLAMAPLAGNVFLAYKSKTLPNLLLITFLMIIAWNRLPPKTIDNLWRLKNLHTLFSR